jgi:tetratricopeptide (TPR) repeat protein
MKRSRFFIAALCAIAFGNAFAQTTDENAVKTKIASAATKYKAGNVKEALSDFEALNKEYPMSAQVASWLGFLYLRNDNALKAIPLLEMANAAMPADLEVVNNLGNAYMKADMKDKALAKYQELATAKSDMFEPYYNMGNIYLAKGDAAKAAGAFQKAAELKKGDANILNNLGVALEKSGKAEKSLMAFKDASDIDPKSGTFARNAGAGMYKAMKYSAAKPYLLRAVSNGIQDKEVILALADCHNRDGETDKAGALYSKHEAMLGGDSSYYFNLGVMRKKAKDMAGAEDAFRRAYKIKDSDPATLDNLGVLLFARGEFEESRVMFEKLVGLQPTARNKRNFAAAAARSGDTAAALPIWKQILASDPADVDVRLLLADAYYEMGDVKSAAMNYKLVQKAKPNSAAALDGIGRCHLLDANYASAEAALRSAIEADPKYVPAYNNLAVVLEKMNKRKQAIALLEKAAAMDPENADVQKNLKRMRSAS